MGNVFVRDLSKIVFRALNAVLFIVIQVKRSTDLQRNRSADMGVNYLEQRASLAAF